MARVVIWAYLEMRKPPGPDHPEVLRLVKKGTNDSIERQMHLALKILLNRRRP